MNDDKARQYRSARRKLEGYTWPQRRELQEKLREAGVDVKSADARDLAEAVVESSDRPDMRGLDGKLQELRLLGLRAEGQE